MKAQEFKECARLAAAPGYEIIPYLSLDTFNGMALDRSRRFATRQQVASMIHGHCATFAGTWDFSEMAELQEMAKRIDLIDT